VRTSNSGGLDDRPVVLHVTECFEGGVSRAIRTMVKNSPEVQHWLAATGSDVDSEIDSDTFANVFELGDGHIGRLRAIRKLLRSNLFEVVHAHSSWAGLYVRLLRVSARIVYQPHGYAFEMSGRLRKMLFLAAEWVLSQRPQTIAVLSPRESHIAKRLNPRASRVMISNLPTVEVECGTLREEHDSAPRVVMVGRLCDQKDPKYFVELMQKVRLSLPRVQAVWVGEGEPELREILVKAGIEVTGWLDEDGLSAELDAAALYVHTAKYEGFPLSVLDAAARGKGIIAREIPAFEGAALVQAATIEKHAALITEAIENGPVRTQAELCSGALLERMNPQRQQAELRTLYGQVAGATSYPRLLW
jgi:glycosyltransferase involved in cell wall biosynthesis